MYSIFPKQNTRWDIILIYLVYYKKQSSTQKSNSKNILNYLLSGSMHFVIITQKPSIAGQVSSHHIPINCILCNLMPVKSCWHKISVSRHNRQRQDFQATTGQTWSRPLLWWVSLDFLLKHKESDEMNLHPSHGQQSQQ